MTTPSTTTATPEKTADELRAEYLRIKTQAWQDVNDLNQGRKPDEAEGTGLVLLQKAHIEDLERRLTAALAELERVKGILKDAESVLSAGRKDAAIWALRIITKGGEAPCPTPAFSTDGVASEHPAPTAPTHPVGSDAAAKSDPSCAACTTLRADLERSKADAESSKNALTVLRSMLDGSKPMDEWESKIASEILWSEFKPDDTLDRLRSELDASMRREGVLREHLGIRERQLRIAVAGMDEGKDKTCFVVLNQNGEIEDVVQTGINSPSHPAATLRTLSALGAGSEEGRGE